MIDRALCTSGLIGPRTTVSELQRALDTWACERVALDHAVSESLAEAWQPFLRDHRPQPVLVIAPCPAPQPVRRGARFARKDLRLASGDRLEREESLAIVRPSFELADQVDAGTVALHGGPLALAGLYVGFERFLREDAVETERGRAARQAFARERERIVPKALDALSFSVETLLPDVEARGQTLALIESDDLCWLGTPSEIQCLLDRFSGGPVAWLAQPMGRASFARIGYSSGEPMPVEMPPRAVLWSVPSDLDEQQIEACRDSIEAQMTMHAEFAVSTAIFATRDGSVFSDWHRTLWEQLAAIQPSATDGGG